MVQVVEVEDLEVDLLRAGLGITADLLDDLGREPARPLAFSSSTSRADHGGPAGDIGVVLADAGDEGVGVGQRVRPRRRPLLGGGLDPAELAPGVLDLLRRRGC